MLEFFKICDRWWRELQYRMVNRLRAVCIKDAEKNVFPLYKTMY